MEIHLHLYSILREKLPPENRGHAVLSMSEGAAISDLLSTLNVKHAVVVAVNGAHEADRSRQLADGDEVKIFPSASGGAG